MQNKKIQLWALSMAGYNCNIEYIAGPTNTCADLLSRLPDVPRDMETPLETSTEEDVVLDVNDNTFEIDVIDSNQFEPKEFASCELPFDDLLTKPVDCLPGFDMVAEQSKDDELQALKTSIVHGEPSKDTQKKHIVVDDTLYYLTDPDNDPTLRLFVPNHLRSLVVKPIP